MIYAVRHGETEWNALNKVLGRSDIPLNARGMEQARGLARSLKDLRIDEILSSPLTRTRQTAEIIAAELGIEYRVDDRLIEQEFGTYEGVDRGDSEYQAAKRKYFVRFPGGESYFDMVSRVYPLIREIEQDGSRNVLIVTHGGICRIIRTYFEDLGNEEFVQFSQGNCEIRAYPTSPDEAA